MPSVSRAFLAVSLILSAYLPLPAQSADPAPDENGNMRMSGLLMPVFDQLEEEKTLQTAQATQSTQINDEIEDVNEASCVFNLRAMKSEGDSRWSLPIYGQLSKATSLIRTAKRVILNEPAKQEIPQLEIGISLSDQHTKISQSIDNLLDCALNNDDKTSSLNKAVYHYNKPLQKAFAEVKDGADYLVPYRGFGPSAEAGNIILGEKIKVKSRASAEYAKQKHIDEKHLEVVSNISQIAMGLGMSDKVRGAQVVESGKTSLVALVGQDEADKTIAMLKSWAKDIDVPQEVFAQGPWDVQARQEKLKTVVSTSLDNDPVVGEIKRRLHKYNQKSKFSMVTSQVVQTTLGVAAMTPTFIGPAAKVALLSFVMATGGPESCKLMKELYLDKRFESRCQVTTEEAHLAVENYHIAVLTKNPVLLAFSESMIADMAGRASVKKVLGLEVLAYATEVSPDKGPEIVQSSAVKTQ
ncbi:MAG: hypothetical protein K2Y22_01450 [Candidatus Obscuribacterales bacterium]|nr:hypothetical protein [Candidatus Obscuribacterales bacterium]